MSNTYSSSEYYLRLDREIRDEPNVFRNQLISSIESFKPDVIAAGFDFPTDDYKNAPLADLSKFQFEILNYYIDHCFCKKA
jgi:hypothetical protein